MLYETKFLIALIVTLLIEVPIVFLTTKFLFKSKIKNLQIILAALIASILTLPYLWFVFPPYFNASYYVLIGETAVTLIEAGNYLWLLNLRLDKALLLSILANFISFSLGRLIF